MNHLPATLAATSTLPATTASDSLNAALVLMVVGMGVVFAALLIMSLGLTLLGRFASANAAKPPEDRAAQDAHESQSPQAAAPDDHAGQHAVVIAAAVAAAIGRPHRIARVVLLEDNPQRDWVAGGRASVMTSHTPRR